LKVIAIPPKPLDEAFEAGPFGPPTHQTKQTGSGPRRCGIRPAGDSETYRPEAVKNAYSKVIPIRASSQYPMLFGVSLSVLLDPRLDRHARADEKQGVLRLNRIKA